MGQLLDHLGRGGQVFRKEQQVVGQIEFLQVGEAATESGPQYKVVVGLVMDNVTNADEFWVFRAGLELLTDVL
jgi:hypothetical protein